MKIKLGKLSNELQVVQEEGRNLSKQHRAATTALKTSEDKHLATKKRLDTFRESYQLAQSCLNEANSSIESGKATLEKERAEHRRREQELEHDLQASRQLLLQHEQEIEALNVQIQKKSFESQVRDDMGEQIGDLKDGSRI